MQAVTASVTGAGSSRPIRVDDFAPSPVTVQVIVSGTATYTVESTLSDPNDPVNPVAAGSLVWIASSDAGVVAATTSKQSGFQYAPKFIRVRVTAGSGTATLTVLQSSNGPA